MQATTFNSTGHAFFHLSGPTSMMPFICTMLPRLKPNGSRIRLLWVIGSAAGTLLGGGLALTLFPGAAMGVNPTGQFSWHLVGFALAIGIPFAITQWSILRYFLKDRELANISFLVLWIPVTCAGIASMLFPLWWLDAEILIFAPWYLVIPMLPGMVVLGLGQWLVLHRVIKADFAWVLRTILGAAIGSVLGLVAGLAGVFFLHLPLEATWSLVMGASIGALQSAIVAADHDADRNGTA